jgi:hypothetical protein
VRRDGGDPLADDDSFVIPGHSYCGGMTRTALSVQSIAFWPPPSPQAGRTESRAERAMQKRGGD